MIIKGQKISDRYLIVRSIGEGGMANVYLAHDTILDRDVAIKVLRGDLSNDEKFVRRFQREALAASSLSHPNIVFTNIIKILLKFMMLVKIMINTILSWNMSKGKQSNNS